MVSVSYSPSNVLSRDVLAKLNSQKALIFPDRINTRDGSPANPTDVSRGIFGATVGIERLLKLWDKYGIKTTWFVPAHSLESFPESLAAVRDKGHEL
jgi:hypothetical protein